MEIFTPLTPEECMRRLSAVMDDEHALMGVFTDFDVLFSQVRHPRPFAGRVMPGRLKLRLRQRGDYQQRSRARLRARLHPHATGTVIAGTFGPTWAEWTFYACMFGFLGYLACTTEGGVWAALFMLAATAVVYFFIRPMTVREEKAIEHFLIQTLDGRTMSP